MAEMIFTGSTEPGRVKSISGNDGGHAERRGEKGEEREGGEIDLARLDAVNLAQCLHLGGEVAVAVDGALGRAGAAAGEEDGGHLVALVGARVNVVVPCGAVDQQWIPPQNQAAANGDEGS